MGSGMMWYDNFIPGLFDLLNLRFAPPPQPTPPEEWVGGIEEMAALQREFQVFREGRSFRDSAALLNVGGFWNWGARKKWYDLLSFYGQCESDVAGQNGDERIVGALIANLALERPWPVYFTAHEWAEPPQVRLIGDPGNQRTLTRPLFYMRQLYLVVSVPMRPQQPQRRRATTRRRASR